MAAAEVEQVHFIGKDIVYFHTLFWPAMLHFAGRKVPENVYVHGFLTVNGGEKMSKSRGTGLDPLRYLALGMNAEWLRYYLAAKLNGRVEDVDFTPEDFLARVNSDLIGKYVNLASRAASFITRHFDGALHPPVEGGGLTAALAAVGDIAALLEAREYGKALREVMRVADFANEHFDRHKPWELAKDAARRGELHAVCGPEAARRAVRAAANLFRRSPATVARRSGTGHRQHGGHRRPSPTTLARLSGRGHRQRGSRKRPSPTTLARLSGRGCWRASASG